MYRLGLAAPRASETTRSLVRRRMMQTPVMSFTPPPMPPLTTMAIGSIMRSEDIIQQGGLFGSRRPRPLSALGGLENKVESLQKTAELEETALDPPYYKEDELAFLYEDLLNAAVGKPEQSNFTSMQPQQQLAEDMYVIDAAHERLCRSVTQRMNTDIETYDAPNQPAIRQRIYNEVIAQVGVILDRLEAAGSRAISQPVATSSQIPVAILTLKECESFLRVALASHDGLAAMSILNIIKKEKVSYPPELVTCVMEFYANAGRVGEFEHLLQNYLKEPPTERQRHLHIKAHLKSYSPDAIPESALQLLHSYEQKAHPAPIQTYTSIITALISTQSSVARAHAWDLFSHMRYVAHTTPDAMLYILMIRACGSPISVRHSSEPERALDLWHEMTVQRGITPTVGAYAAIILACAKSGRPMYINEAFRLAKQMLDSHRDARGVSAYRPDKRVFCALLEGAKRIGDLTRARWILVEMAQGTDELGESNAATQIDDEVMMHIFHTYAAYTPPYHRADTPVVDVEPTRQEPYSIPASQNPVPEPQAPTKANSKSVFSRIPPQSQEEVLSEARILFKRITRESREDIDSGSEGFSWKEKIFANVELTPRLVNSYLSVVYKHAPLEVSQTLFPQIFEFLRIQPTLRSYVEALERCARARKIERAVALTFARELWEKWGASLDNTGMHHTSVSRFVERAHIAMIKVLTLTDNLDGALEQVRRFTNLYPAKDVRNPPQNARFRSQRITLTGDRPLVHMISPTEIPDDHVPPLFTFSDLETLHHRLVAANRAKDIGYIKYISKAYEGALRVRREQMMGAKAE